MNSMEGERSLEENDQLVRSTKKVKRTGETSVQDEGPEAMDTDSPTARESGLPVQQNPFSGRTASYCDTLQRNNPYLVFETKDNPIWVDNDNADVSDDDEFVGEDDRTCPTILLTAEEKRMLREPWRNALILRMFDKGIGYLQLKRRLKTKWALRGDFSLIDIGYGYCVTRFTNLEDYEHVMLNGP